MASWPHHEGKVCLCATEPSVDAAADLVAPRLVQRVLAAQRIGGHLVHLLRATEMELCKEVSLVSQIRSGRQRPW